MSNRGVITIAAVLMGTACAACSDQGIVKTWNGRIERPQVDFYKQSYASTDVKVLCSKKDGALSLQITSPAGQTATTTQGTDGSQVSDITVVSNGESKILPRAAQWATAQNETGFLLDPSGEFDDVFYLHDGAALCLNQS